MYFKHTLRLLECYDLSKSGYLKVVRVVNGDCVDLSSNLGIGDLELG